MFPEFSEILFSVPYLKKKRLLDPLLPGKASFKSELIKNLTAVKLQNIPFQLDRGELIITIFQRCYKCHLRFNYHNLLFK